VPNPIQSNPIQSNPIPSISGGGGGDKLSEYEPNKSTIKSDIESRSKGNFLFLVTGTRCYFRIGYSSLPTSLLLCWLFPCHSSFERVRKREWGSAHCRFLVTLSSSFSLLLDVLYFTACFLYFFLSPVLGPFFVSFRFVPLLLVGLLVCRLWSRATDGAIQSTQVSNYVFDSMLLLFRRRVVLC
jgi:hypothetical protein